MKWARFSSFFLISLSLGASELPWLTGPLIAPTGQVVPYGDFLLKSYLSAKLETKRPNHFSGISSDLPFYNVNYQGLYFFGITSWADVNIVPRLSYNTCSHVHSVQMGDFTVGLDIQLLSVDETPYFPGIKLAVRENFPTGKYEFLSPRKFMTDQTGTGSFATQFDLVFYKIFHLYKLHWLSMTLSNEYTINTPVDVRGFNAYGGGFGTKGTVLPGNTFRAILSFELTLNRYLAFALDNEYIYTEDSKFYGMKGIGFDGNLAKVGDNHSAQLNFATSIEANFSPRFGIIAGFYFSTFRENSAQFRSAVVNFNYSY